jgi:FkbM family methyltransferase
MINIESTVEEWNEVDGDNTLRVNYDLDEKSIVFDIGSHKGEFAKKIGKKYGSRLYCFEPIGSFYNSTRLKNERAKVYKFGLGASDRVQKIFMMDNGTSVFNYSDIEDHIDIEIRDIVGVVSDLGINKIDLMKINIEGGEYELLDRIIESGMVGIISNIQVQFHHFVEGAIERRKKIQTELQKTHNMTYNYEFVWENWEIMEEK